MGTKEQAGGVFGEWVNGDGVERGWVEGIKRKCRSTMK
jgi:hypothetical protein